MATATNPSPIVKTPASHQRGSNQRGSPAARLATIVDRTYTQYDFLRQVIDSSAKSLSSRVDRTYTQYDFLRQVIDSSAKSLSSRDGPKPIAVKLPSPVPATRGG